MTYYNVQDSMYITTSGNNIGLGITNPSKKLEVVGDIDTTTDYNINGTQVLSATTLGSAVVNSSLTSLGTQAEDLNMGDNKIDSCQRITLDSDSVTNKLYMTRAENASNGFYFTNSTSNNITLNNSENADIIFKTNSTARLTLDASGDIDCNSNNITSVADIAFTSATIKGHMIPDTDDTYDIGSAEFKIRDLYVSDNSMWIGDTHKISISGGKMKFRKRKTTTVPAAIIAAAQAADGSATESSVESAAIAHAGVINVEAMKLKHWKKYMRTLSGQSGATIQDIFRDNTDDYSEESETNWLQSGTKTYNTTGNLGLGTSDPSALLSLHYDPESSQGLKELMRLSWHDANYNTLKGDGVKISFHQPDTNNFPGTKEAGYFGVMKANAAEADQESDITIANHDGTNMVERIRILSDGNVGIGDFSSSSPGYKLDVVGDINFTGTLYQNDSAFTSGLSELPGDTRQGFVKTYTASSGDMFGIEQVSSAQSGISRPEMRLFTSEEGTAGIGFGKYTNATSFDHQMVIDQDGNVGIGDTSPSYKLDVAGDINLTGDLRINGTATSFSDTNTQLTQEQVEDYINGLIVAGSNITKTYNDSAGTLTIAAAGGSSVWSEASGEAYYIGNVGVGIANPGNPLHVYSSQDWLIKVESSDGKSGIRLKDTHDETFIMTHSGTTSIGPEGSVHANNINILANGKIGMGTTSPDEKLQVVGDIGFGANSKLVLDESSWQSCGNIELTSGSGTFGFHGSGSNTLGINVDGNVTAASMTCNGTLIASSYIQGKQHHAEIELKGNSSSSNNLYNHTNQAQDVWRKMYLNHSMTAGEPIAKVGTYYTFNRSFVVNNGFNDTNKVVLNSQNSPNEMYQLKCSAKGLYHVDYSIKHFNNCGTDAYGYGRFRVNASGTSYGYNRTWCINNKTYYLTGSAVVRMNAGDYIVFETYTNEGGGHHDYNQGRCTICMIGTY
jgi:hypothetical protein